MTRDIVVAGALPRHQVKQYLNALGVEWRGWPVTANESMIRVVDATEAQWGQIQEWIRKVTGCQ